MKEDLGSAPTKLLIVWPGEVGKPNIVRPDAGGAAAGTSTMPPGASGATSGSTSGAQPSGSPQ